MGRRWRKIYYHFMLQRSSKPWSKQLGTENGVVWKLMGKTFWEMGCGDKHREETALFEVRLHPGNQEKQSQPLAGQQWVHTHAHGIQTLSRDKHLIEANEEWLFWKKELGKWYFLPVLGNAVIIFSGRDVSSGGQGLGTISLVPLNINSKSKCLDLRESQKMGEPKGKWWKWEMSVLLNTLHWN